MWPWVLLLPNQHRKAGRQHFSQSSCDSAWSAMHVSQCSAHHACLPLPLSLRCISRQQGASAGCSPRRWLPLLPLRQLPLHQQPLHPRQPHQHSAGQRPEPDLLAYYVRRAAGCMGAPNSSEQMGLHGWNRADTGWCKQMGLHGLERERCSTHLFILTSSPCCLLVSECNHSSQPLQLRPPSSWGWLTGPNSCSTMPCASLVHHCSAAWHCAALVSRARGNWLCMRITHVHAAVVAVHL